MTSRRLARQIVLAVCFALSIFSMTPDEGQAQPAEVWLVFVNGSTRPAVIGVATSRYSEPGWGKLSNDFGSEADAWKAACRFHELLDYFSPDIDQGLVACGTLVDGAGSTVAPSADALTEVAALADRFDIWFVFMTGSTKPATIAVATSRFNEPQWGKLSAAFGSDVEAWNAACKFHELPEYFSPDIAAGRIDCGGPEADVPLKKKLLSCSGSFHGTWSTNYHAKTKIWVEGSRIRGDYQNGRKFAGRVEGCKFIGEWYYESSARRGPMSLTLSGDGQSFAGTWSEPGGRQDGRWTGEKVSDSVD